VLAQTYPDLQRNHTTTAHLCGREELLAPAALQLNSKRAQWWNERMRMLWDGWRAEMDALCKNQTCLDAVDHCAARSNRCSSVASLFHFASNPQFTASPTLARLQNVGSLQFAFVESPSAPERQFHLSLSLYQCNHVRTFSCPTALIRQG
jgi:hypothetical protein